MKVSIPLLFILLLSLCACSHPSRHDAVAVCVKEKFSADECSIYPATHVSEGDTFSVLKVELANLQEPFAALPFWANSSAASLLVYKLLGSEKLAAYDGVDVAIGDKSVIGMFSYSEGSSIGYSLASLQKADSLYSLSVHMLLQYESGKGFVSSRVLFDSVITDLNLHTFDSVVTAQTKYSGSVLETRLIGFRYITVPGYPDSMTAVDIAQHYSVDEWHICRFVFNDRTLKVTGIQLDPPAD
jgi:hypothetical protein